jgi:tRNA 2-selenouridine synthase
MPCWINGILEIIDVRSPSEYQLDSMKSHILAQKHFLLLFLCSSKFVFKLCIYPGIPGSLNAPVLSDSERVAVGTQYRKKYLGLLYVEKHLLICYSIDSKFQAKLIGAQMISKNISQILAKYGTDFQPSMTYLGMGSLSLSLSLSPHSALLVVYCWRGGQRSQSLAHVMNQIGYRVGEDYVLSFSFAPFLSSPSLKVSTLEGGYKTYREAVCERLKLLSEFRYIVIGGLTGTGKGNQGTKREKRDRY